MLPFAKSTQSIQYVKAGHKTAPSSFVAVSLIVYVLVYGAKFRPLFRGCPSNRLDEHPGIYGQWFAKLILKRYYIEFWKVIKNLKPEGFVKDASVKGTLYILLWRFIGCWNEWIIYLKLLLQQCNTYPKFTYSGNTGRNIPGSK